MEIIFHSAFHALKITFFIISMMVFIDFINVVSKGNWTKKLKTNLVGQNFLGSFLGALPGCLGPFTISSLYFHNLIRFGAITATMLATSGDESFVMFALFPKTAFILTLLLFIIGFATGLIIDLILKARGTHKCCSHEFSVHENEEEHTHFSFTNVRGLFKAPLFPKLPFSLIIIVFSGLFIKDISRGLESKPLIFLIVSIIFLFITLFADDHFIEDHVYKHIIKSHLTRLLIWTSMSLAAIHLVMQYNFSGHITGNHYLMILIAALIGLIPESGPHLLFVTLFAQGIIPFSVLLSSSISQDGHGSLPLFSQSKKDFLAVKTVNLAVALLFGYAALLIGF